MLFVNLVGRHMTVETTYKTFAVWILQKSDFSSSDVTGSKSDRCVSFLAWLHRSVSDGSVGLASIAGTQTN